MFDLGMQELIIIFVVALIVFGPQKLPELARTLGKGMRELKRAMHGIKNTFEEADIRRTDDNKIADFTLSPPSDKDLEKYKGKDDSSQTQGNDELKQENTPDFTPSHSFDNNDIEKDEKHKVIAESPTTKDDDKRLGARQKDD